MSTIFVELLRIMYLNSGKGFLLKKKQFNVIFLKISLFKPKILPSNKNRFKSKIKRTTIIFLFIKLQNYL